jgi:hypothetical protein
VPFNLVLRTKTERLAESMNVQTLIQIGRAIRNSGFALAACVIAVLALASHANAQYKPTGDDGITASPKLRQFLNEYHRNHSPAPKPVEIPQMTCPKCTDFTWAIPDMEPRGLGARTLMAGGTPMKWVTDHMCTGCGTKWETKGVGKAMKSVAIHTCSRCGSKNLACCNTTKGSTAATKGMETRIEVAPPK